MVGPEWHSAKADCILFWCLIIMIWFSFKIFIQIVNIFIIDHCDQFRLGTASTEPIKK